MPARLYLIPNFLTAEAGIDAISSYIINIVKNLRYFMVEEERSARRFLRKFEPEFPLQECVFFELSEHTPFEKAQEFFNAHAKQDIGVIPEVGCPCVADPGAEIVLLAHQKGVEVVPLIGPSSILLALMASGLNGQNFVFSGYLPKEGKERLAKIKELEKRSFLEGQAQIFMETPYHNENLFKEIISVCEPNTLVTVACDLTAPTQYIKTLSVKEWQKTKVSLHKKPTIFLIQKR